MRPRWQQNCWWQLKEYFLEWTHSFVRISIQSCSMGLVNNKLAYIWTMPWSWIGNVWLFKFKFATVTKSLLSARWVHFDRVQLRCDLTTIITFNFFFHTYDLTMIINYNLFCGIHAPYQVVWSYYNQDCSWFVGVIRANSRFAPSQWETALLCNDVSHWLDASLEPALSYGHDIYMICCSTQRAKFMGPTWGPPGSCRPQMGPMLAPWNLLSG